MDNITKIFSGTVAAIAITTSVNAAEVDWKDNPEFGDTDNNHCITISSGEVEDYDESSIERFLKNTYEESGEAGFTISRRYHLFSGQEERNGNYNICLSETAPGVKGSYSDASPTITLNEDYFRYSVEVLGNWNPSPVLLSGTLDHEEEHRIIALDHSGVAHTKASFSGYLDELFQEEMIATLAQVEGNLQRMSFHMYEDPIVEAFNMSGDYSVVFNNWMETQSKTYACKAHFSYLNAATSLDIHGSGASLIGEHWYDEGVIAGHFNEGSSFYERMQVDIESYSTMSANGVWSDPSDCVDPQKTDSQYNLTEQEIDSIRQRHNFAMNMNTGVIALD